MNDLESGQMFHDTGWSGRYPERREEQVPQNVENHQTNYKQQQPERTNYFSTQGIQIPYI